MLLFKVVSVDLVTELSDLSFKKAAKITLFSMFTSMIFLFLQASLVAFSCFHPS